MHLCVHMYYVHKCDSLKSMHVILYCVYKSQTHLYAIYVLRKHCQQILVGDVNIKPLTKDPFLIPLK